MLKSLILTTLITTGVANTTPVYNAPNLPKQADNITTNYTLTLSQQNFSQTNYGNQETGYLSYTGIDTETIRNYQGNNQAINVLASQYKTQVNRTENNIKYEFITNATWYDENVYKYDNASQIVTVFQIDSYNYNLDTETTTTLKVQLQDNNFNLSNYHMVQTYWLKDVYYTTDDWSTYLHRQSTTFLGRNVIEEIENVNSNFYYTKHTNWLLGGIRQDTTEINLQPNRTNYIVISYMPMVLAEDNGTEVGSNYTTIPTVDPYGMSIDSFTFTGTNVIPTGTYEVVDIPGLMWQILAMPFSFVSQAFNLTLFPGTPYQVNISNLFLSIIAIFVFVWLIGLLFKLKG